VQKVALPKEIPRGLSMHRIHSICRWLISYPAAKFNVDIKAFNDDEANLLCVKLTIDFMTGQPSRFRIFGL
jgi:hypothetical protein